MKWGAGCGSSGIGIKWGAGCGSSGVGISEGSSSVFVVQAARHSATTKAYRPHRRLLAPCLAPTSPPLLDRACGRLPRFIDCIRSNPSHLETADAPASRAGDNKSRTPAMILADQRICLVLNPHVLILAPSGMWRVWVCWKQDSCQNAHNSQRAARRRWLSQGQGLPKRRVRTGWTRRDGLHTGRGGSTPLACRGHAPRSGRSVRDCVRGSEVIPGRGYPAARVGATLSPG